MLRADKCWANSAVVWRDEGSPQAQQADNTLLQDASGGSIHRIVSGDCQSSLGIFNDDCVTEAVRLPKLEATMSASTSNSSCTGYEAAALTTFFNGTSVAKTSSCKQCPQWEVVRMSGSGEGVAIGHDIVPLDVVSAGEMPDLAARLRVDTQGAWLQSLYSQQVAAPLLNS